VSNKIEMMQHNKRNYFNPNSTVDMSVAKGFLKYNSWGSQGCPFFLEWPYLDVTSMIKDKISKHALGLL